MIAKRKGVCQDFAHLFIAILRAAGIPARYVSGYIETEAQANVALSGRDPLELHDLQGVIPPPPTGKRGSGPHDHDQPLIGATASHAWVEFCAPNGLWIGIDPTNNMLESERHVQIGIGRDYSDVPPLRGVFKGARKQVLSVKVTVARTPGEMPETGADADSSEDAQGQLIS